QQQPLFCRALCIEAGGRRLVVASLDLLCLSWECRKRVLEKVSPACGDDLVLCATHTHSAPGGLFPKEAAFMLGKPNPEFAETAADAATKAIEGAFRDLAPAGARWATCEFAGLTGNRRERMGPRDDSMVLLRLERTGLRDILLVNGSGHPVVVSEHDPHMVHPDYPGVLCNRLEKEMGLEALFVPAALGGLSILFPEFPLPLAEHLQLVTSLQIGCIGRGLENTKPLAADATLEVKTEALALGFSSDRIFRPLGAAGIAADLAFRPLRTWLERRMRTALAFPEGVPLHVVRLDGFALVATAFELGVELVAALRRLLMDAGAESVAVVSLANGYAGYLHPPATYGRKPASGFRFLAYYENALAPFGHAASEKLLERAKTLAAG
ncbi:MAG: hypothetical protein D6806_17180, partial [Deltaproteobacteria bacterium]